MLWPVDDLKQRLNGMEKKKYQIFFYMIIVNIPIPFGIIIKY